MKKILVIDDSALMRRIFVDMLASDGRFEVSDTAKDGIEGLKMLETKKYDAIILDINMPKMNGIEFLNELRAKGNKERIVVISADTADGAAVTIEALSLGAIDFIQKPKNALDARTGDFKRRFFEIMETVTDIEKTNSASANASPVLRSGEKKTSPAEKKNDNARKHSFVKGKKLVAIACSTGGPNALQHVIPKLPKNLNAPVVIVQHMPAGFTKSLAERLDSLSKVDVSEAQENDSLKKGHVYISQGGKHLRIEGSKQNATIYYSDEPAREGVKPAANYMYESLINSNYEEIVCVVLTGMGQDGRAGITNLSETNNLFVIAQSEPTCTVFGMPKAIVSNDLSDEVVDLDKIADEITLRVGIC